MYWIRENGLYCDPLMYIYIYYFLFIYLFIYLVYPYSNVDHMKLHACVLYYIYMLSFPLYLKFTLDMYGLQNLHNYWEHVNHMYVK